MSEITELRRTSSLSDSLWTTFLVLAAILIAPVGAHAQIYVNVNVTGGADDGSSWANAYTDLQDALDAATGSDQIWIAEGTYTPTFELDTSDPRTATFYVAGDQDGLKVYGGFAGTESSLSERDLTAGNETILSGDLNADDGEDTDGDGIPDSGFDDNTYHVLVFDGAGSTGSIGPTVTGNLTSATVLNGVTVEGGNASGDIPFRFKGGGLYCAGGRNNCSPTISHVTFSGNSAGDDVNGNGGAIYNDGSSSPTIINTTFIGNSANTRGGAIYNDGVNSDRGSNPKIINVTFSNNSTTGDGGAIFNDGRFSGKSSPTITNTVFYNNSAGQGGAIFNDGGYPNGESSPAITNTTFYNNYASGAGRSLLNRASDTGTSSPTVTNTIIWGNESRFTREVDGATPQYSHSLVLNLDLSSVGTGNLNGRDPANDPLFVDVANPEGSDDTFGTADDGLRLSPGSPIIDVGDASRLPSDMFDFDGDGDTSEPLSVDLIGSPRQQDVVGVGDDTGFPVDLGAYEAPGDPLPVELTRLTAEAHGNAVVLAWSTASEKNNAGFEVQRRTSSKWITLSFVEGEGTTSEPQNYRYQDTDLPYEADSVRYRLKQIDTDGTTTLSKTRALKLGAPGEFALHAPFPNPAQRQTTLRYALPSKTNVSIRIYDVLGRRVATLQRGMEDAGRKEVQVSTSDLSPGTYFVRMQAGEKMKTKQLTIVR